MLHKQTPRQSQHINKHTLTTSRWCWCRFRCRTLSSAIRSKTIQRRTMCASSETYANGDTSRTPHAIARRCIRLCHIISISFESAEWIGAAEALQERAAWCTRWWCWIWLCAQSHMINHTIIVNHRIPLDLELVVVMAMVSAMAVTNQCYHNSTSHHTTQCIHCWQWCWSANTNSHHHHQHTNTSNIHWCWIG